MFRALLHLLLSAVLLGCPYLCQRHCSVCGTHVASEAASDATCCRHCRSSYAADSERWRSHNERRAPCDPLQNCECNCLCRGAITDPSQLVGLQMLACWCQFVADNATSPVSASAAGVSADLPPPFSTAQFGRTLRAAIMSFLC